MVRGNDQGFIKPEVLPTPDFHPAIENISITECYPEPSEMIDPGKIRILSHDQ